MRMSPLRQVRLDDWASPVMLRVSLPARMTAMLLHLAADGYGRAVVDLPALLARLYPRRDDPVTEADLEAHLLELADAGVLTLYTDAEGRELLEMASPVGVNRRAPSRHPSPSEPGCRELPRRPRRPVGMAETGGRPPYQGEEDSRTVMSTHGYGEREREMGKSERVRRARESGRERSEQERAGANAGECADERVEARVGRERAVEEATARVLAAHAREQAERRSEWKRWAEEQAQEDGPPEVPILLDGPPIGCPQHPNGTLEPCGPCRTAREQRDLWLTRARYEERLARWAARKAARELEYEEVF